MADPDPVDEVRRVLDLQRTLTASWAIPPLIFLVAAFGALVAELPELAAILGLATLLTGAVAGLTAWDRLRKIRLVEAILDQAAQDRPDDP